MVEYTPSARILIKDVYRTTEFWRKPVLIGRARTWSDVAELLRDTREGAGARLSRECSESKTAFYVKARNRDL